MTFIARSVPTEMSTRGGTDMKSGSQSEPLSTMENIASMFASIDTEAKGYILKDDLLQVAEAPLYDSVMPHDVNRL